MSVDQMKKKREKSTLAAQKERIRKNRKTKKRTMKKRKRKRRKKAITAMRDRMQKRED